MHYKRPVTLNLQKVSRFEAIEEVCRQVGVSPSYDARGITFATGKRPYPVAVSGPFLLVVSQVDEYQPNAAGSLMLDIHTTPMPPRIAALFATMPVFVSGLQVRGPAGEDLHHAGKNVGLPSATISRALAAPSPFCDLPGASIEQGGQAAAVAEFQHHVGAVGRPDGTLADLEDLHDVRVLEAGQRLALGLETGQFLLPAAAPARIILTATRRLRRPCQAS